MCENKKEEFVSYNYLEDWDYIQHQIQSYFMQLELEGAGNNTGKKHCHKNFTFSFARPDIEGNMASVYVAVKKSWKYEACQEITSSQVDFYLVEMQNRNEIWTVSDIKEIPQSRILKEDSVSEENNFFRENELGSLSVKAQELSYYDRELAVEYALRYALTPNERYPYFAADCTNFTSQCLVAGGIPMHYGKTGHHDCWFYENLNLRSSSWAGSKLFRWYMKSKKCRIQWESADWFSVEPGDLIQLLRDGEAYHSLIVTDVIDVNGNRSDVLFSCHTLNRRNVSLAETYSMVEKEYYHIKGIR